MGPVRSLYEQQGGLERAVMQQPSGGGPVMLRPVQMSDCGKHLHGVRQTHRLSKSLKVSYSCRWNSPNERHCLLLAPSRNYEHRFYIWSSFDLTMCS